MWHILGEPKWLAATIEFEVKARCLGFDCSAYLLYNENLDLCVGSGLSSETEKG